MDLDINALLMILEILLNTALLPVYIMVSLFEVVFPPKDKSLNNLVILVTGAANGLGKEIVRQLLRFPCTIICVDMKEKDLKLTLDTFNEEPKKGAVYPFVCDISDITSVNRLRDQVLQRFQKVDIVINNAGLLYVSTFTNGQEHDMKRTIDVNLLGVMWMTKAFLPSMQRAKEGQMVYVSSASSILSSHGMNVYSASKAGVSAFAMALKEELEANPEWKEVVITCVNPSFIDSNQLVRQGARSVMPFLTVEEAAESIISATRRNLFQVFLPGNELTHSICYILRAMPWRYYKRIKNAFKLQFAEIKKPELLTKYMSSEDNVDLLKDIKDEPLFQFPM